HARRRYAPARRMAEDAEDVLAGRPLRHLGTWTPGPRAEGTVGSRAMPDLGLAEMPAARPPEAPAAPAAGAPAAKGQATATLSREGRLAVRLRDRVGRRGVLALVALLAVGVAFPLAARHPRTPPGVPLPALPLPTLAPALEPGHLE